MRKLFIASGILGLTGVLLGAFGAHALQASLQASHGNQIWETAVHYQFLHAIALLALLSFAEHRAVQSPQLIRWLQRAGWCWIVGVIFFSGSLYGLSLGGPRWLGPITPIGGLLLIIGWSGLIAVAAKANFSKNKS